MARFIYVGAEHMMRFFYLLLMALLLFAAKAGFAADPIEGYYRSVLPADCFDGATPSATPSVCHVEQGLNIKRRNKAAYYIWLHTEGNFSHFCSYRGIAHMENGKLVSGDSECKVFIEVNGVSADISTSGDGCNAYCGANVGLAIGGLKKKQ